MHNSTTDSMSPDARPVIALTNVSKSYRTPAGLFTALDDITLSVARGEFLMVLGHSGSGKSTMLNLLAGIDRPTHGSIRVGGTAVHELSERALSAWRGRSVGIVFQFLQLLPTLTAAENVMLPMDFCHSGVPRERRGRAVHLLDRLGVADQADKLPGTLSGGQQQRVAVARALANDPAVVLADEPTGNLDSRTADSMLALLASLVGDGHTIVMVTHDHNAREYASRLITLSDGRVAEHEAQAHV